MKNPTGIITLSVIICLAAGSLSGLFTIDALIDWYPTLKKPVWNPPNSVFGPVWTLLYLLMGISAGIIISKQNLIFSRHIKWFALQLALNFFWSLIFFKLQNPALALIELCLLWLSILYTIFLFYRISKPAAILLIPYILWVTFAGFLNANIWILNA